MAGHVPIAGVCALRDGAHSQARFLSGVYFVEHMLVLVEQSLKLLLRAHPKC
ncbi:MAG: hypothetical protein AB7O04_12315 [Hyphomonadaceae bacterium]